MIQIQNPKDCCGCTACASICTHDAITMEPDVLGFQYPKVDNTKCVDCGLCEKVCQFNDYYDKSQNLLSPIAYGARHKSISEVELSRSGAAFVAISDYVLESGGIIYGAGWGKHFKVEHKRATTKKERDQFRGSKYVQSDLKDTFRNVKRDLEDGKLVLFSGTPCQTAGLGSYIGKKLRKNLILVDIVCHGTPSPYIWRDFVNHFENKYGKIYKADFREKNENGWRDHKEAFLTIHSPNKWHYDFVKMHSPWKTWYTVLFYQHIMFRHSCGNCHFCNLQRPSDITLADFWGWEKQNSQINADDKGVNLVLVNTVKGKDLFGAIKENLIVIEADSSSYMQPNLQHPSKIHTKRMQFEKDYKEKGFGYVYSNDYDSPSLYMRLLLNCKRIIKRMLMK